MNKKQVILLLLISLSGLMVSCGIIRETHHADLGPVPDTYLNSNETGQVKTDPWWPAFKDTTLNRLMDEAFQNNLTIEQSVARFNQYRALKSMANSSLFPSLSVSGSNQRMDAVKDYPIPATQQVNEYSESLSASWEFDLWGRLSFNRASAKLTMQAGKEDLNATVLSISSQLARTYFQYIELKLQLDLLNKSIESYQNSYELTRARYERGVVSSLDVYQSENILASAKAQKAVMKANLKQTVHAISVLLGNYPGENLEISQSNLSYDLEELSPGIPSELLLRRPDIKAAFMRMQAADYDWAESVANRFPKISISGSINSSGEKIEDVTNPNTMLWNAIGNITLPIFAGGQLKAQSDQAKAVYEEIAARYKSVVLTAFKEVEDALVLAEKQQEYLKELERQVNASRSALRIASDRYLQGVTDYLPVVTAQTSYYNAQSSLISARRELLDYRIQLVTAIGGGWEEDVLDRPSVSSLPHQENINNVR